MQRQAAVLIFVRDEAMNGQAENTAFLSAKVRANLLKMRHIQYMLSL